MKISDRTKKILKNFSVFSNHLIVEPGNRLVSCEYGNESAFAIATTSETFPVPFAIGDLGQFLSVLSLVEEPEVEFMNNHALISNPKDGSRAIEYLYTEKNVLRQPRTGVGRFKASHTIMVGKTLLGSIQSAVSVLQAPTIRFHTVKGILMLTASSQRRSQGHKFTQDFGPSPHPIDVSLRPDFFQPIPDDYTFSFLEGKRIVGIGKDDLFYLFAGEIGNV